MKTREVVFITGKTGTGKSFLFRKLIQEEPRFIILDTIKEYSMLPCAFPAVKIFDFHSLLAFLRQNYRKPSFRIVFDPQNSLREIALLTGENISVLGLLCRIVYDSLSNVALGIEELGKHSTDRANNPDLYDIICLGRHKEISLYATTQRPAQISTDFKAQITKLYTFRQHLKNDIDWIGDCIGDKNSSKELLTLENYKYKEYAL